MKTCSNRIDRNKLNRRRQRNLYIATHRHNPVSPSSHPPLPQVPETNLPSQKDQIPRTTSPPRKAAGTDPARVTAFRAAGRALWQVESHSRGARVWTFLVTSVIDGYSGSALHMENGHCQDFDYRIAELQGCRNFRNDRQSTSQNSSNYKQFKITQLVLSGISNLYLTTDITELPSQVNKIVL